MRKVFLMNDNGENKEVEMTQEEALKQFKVAREKFAYKCHYNISGDCMDRDDYRQIGDMVILRAYEKYDIGKGTCLNTIIQNEFKGKYGHMISNITAQKRGGGKTSFMSINDDSEEIQTTLEKYLSTDESGYDTLANSEVFHQVVSMLDEKDLSVLPIVLGYIGISELSRDTKTPRMTIHRRLDILRAKLERCKRLVVA